MRKVSKVLGWGSLGGWFAPLLCCLAFSIYGVSYVKLRWCIFFSRRPSVAFSTAWDCIKDKRGVWDLMPELTITSLYVHSRVDSNTAWDCIQRETWCMGNPIPESTFTLCQSRLNRTVRNLEFGLYRLYITQQFLSTINSHNFWFCAGFLLYQYMLGKKVIGICNSI
jgi:hypothetical protein